MSLTTSTHKLKREYIYPTQKSLKINSTESWVSWKINIKSISNNIKTLRRWVRDNPSEKWYNGTSLLYNNNTATRRVWQRVTKWLFHSFFYLLRRWNTPWRKITFFFCCVFSLVVLFVNTSCGVFHYYSRVEKERREERIEEKSPARFYYIHPGEGASKQHNKQQNTFCSRIDCEGDGEERNGRILGVGCARGAWKKSKFQFLFKFIMKIMLSSRSVVIISCTILLDFFYSGPLLFFSDWTSITSTMRWTGVLWLCSMAKRWISVQTQWELNKREFSRFSKR